MKAEVEKFHTRIFKCFHFFPDELFQTVMDFICGKSPTELFKMTAEKIVEKTEEEIYKYVGQKNCLNFLLKKEEFEQFLGKLSTLDIIFHIVKRCTEIILQILEQP